MRYLHSALLALAAATLVACGGDGGEHATTAPPPPPPPPPPTVLLKDMVVSRLPAPYYHFEYDDAGRVKLASFASGFTRYDVTYVDGRIAEMRNNTLGNMDRLEYVYDDAGRVSAVKYHDPSGSVHAVVFLSYDGRKLTGVERDRRVAGGFVVDQTMAMSYYPDGNLQSITEHRPAIDGLQPEETTVDHYERYDAGVNVDGFGLIHDDFFDHLVLLPGVQLQKGNPARETRTGDGINYTVDYVYADDGAGRPLTKSGDLVITNGQDTGRHFALSTVFTYY